MGTHDFKDFRQTALLTFLKEDMVIINFKELIDHLETLEYVKSVSPVYSPNITIEECLIKRIESKIKTKITDFLGTYNNTSVVTYSTMSTGEKRSEIVAGIEFTYLSNNIVTYYEDNLYSLTEAYELDYLKTEDIFWLFYFYMISAII